MLDQRVCHFNYIVHLGSLHVLLYIVCVFLLLFTEIIQYPYSADSGPDHG